MPNAPMPSLCATNTPTAKFVRLETAWSPSPHESLLAVPRNFIAPPRSRCPPLLLHQARVHQCGGRGGGGVEREAGALGDVEQAVVAVGEVQYPEHRELRLLGVAAPAEGVVQAPLAQLRLAVRGQVHVVP